MNLKQFKEEGAGTNDLVVILQNLSDNYFYKLTPKGFSQSQDPNKLNVVAYAGHWENIPRAKNDIDENESCKLFKLKYDH